MTDKERRRKLIQHKRKQRDRYLRVIIFLLSVLVGMWTVVLIELIRIGVIT